MIPFDLAEPTSLAAAIKLLNPDDPTIRPIAGGTALMLMMKAGVFNPERLVSLRKIESKYSSIAAGSDGLRIGAMTTLSALEHSAEVKKHAPVIIRTLLTLSNVRVRNVATVGGALAHGDPHMDLPPVLMALGATMTVTGPKGERKLAVEDLFSGYYETVLEKNELISEIHVPSQGKKKAAYMKVTTGSADDWPALGVCAVIESDGKAIKSARIVASAATDKATRLKSAEAVLNGKSVDDMLLAKAGEAAVEECEFIADVRGSVPYKKELMKVYVRRAVRAALDGGSALMAATLNPPVAKVGSQVGRSVPRLEGRDKVTGRAEYTHTMRVPGMVFAKLFRSTVAHGKIKSIDTSAAKKIPGVLHVVTVDDVMKLLKSPYYGPAFHDQPILAHEKVRFVGEPVAAVIATDPHIAEQAVQLITAEYEEMDAVYDEVDALTSKVYVHEELKPAHTFADLKHLKNARGTNLALDYRLRRGDFDKAYAAAEHKFEHEFRTQKVLHLSFEPFACICDYKDNHVTFYDSTQGPSFVRTEMARLLGWPENKVRIKVPYLGSGYGSKLYIKLEALALALSMIARKPVKVAHTFEEMFYQITRHPSTFRIKSGVDNNGKIVARKCEVYWNGGAYADIGPRVTQKSGLTAAGPYDIDNVWIDSYALYTNVTPSGALRGFGVPQLVWAYEGHTDMMARALKMDPVEFRRKNLAIEGKPHATGQILKDHPVEKVMDKVLERMEWSKPFERGGNSHIKRGRGFAIANKAVISPTTSVAIVNVSADGSATLYCGTVDMGQGSDTAMAQMVGEVLNIPAESVRVTPRDTDVTPYDMGTLGSRSLFHMGHAVRRAAEDARDKLKALAKEVGEPEGSNIPIADLFVKRYGMQAGNVIGSGIYKPDYTPPAPGTGQSPNVTPFWMVAGAGAEVEVDTETGHVKITKLINVVDCGKAINPKSVETQISGAALMHLGFTMFEKMHIDGGQVTNASLADYKIPGFHDLPAKMENLYVEHDQSNGPFGAKGVGEVATFCVGPALANAIDDAVGVRIMEMPLNAETVYRALRTKMGKPLEDA